MATTLPLALPVNAALRRAPFQRLAVADPPFAESYEVVIALAPPLSRGTVGRLITRAATTIDELTKSERLTEALDPDQTQLHEHFVRTLADELADAQVQTLLVPVQPASNEAAVLADLRRQAPQADGLMLANVMGRFVALHGLQAYAPALMVGVKVLPAHGDGRPWLEQVYSIGFRGVDPLAEHLDSPALDARFDNMDALLAGAPQARAALVRGAEAAAAVVAQRLMA
jgi:hypothetical protein